MAWRIDISGRAGTLSLAIQLESDAIPTCLIGPNGAGKTTLLRAICGAPIAGMKGLVRLGDTTLFDSSQAIDVPPEHREIGYVPQGYQLFPHLTVLDNVAFGCRAQGASRKLARIKAASLLELLNVAALSQRRPTHLSGGERQRVALARALAVEPRALLLDEPLAALDVGARRETRQLLAELLHRTNRPALVATHDARDVFALGGRVVAIEAGRVVQAGTADELAQDPRTDFVREFFDH